MLKPGWTFWTWKKVDSELEDDPGAAPMKRITPFIWFDGKAERAARFYTSIFKRSKILGQSPMATSFSLNGQEFIALNGGPEFKITPAISFFVRCETQKEVDYYWKRLSSGGTILQCGWLTDKFGVTWQIVPAILGRLLGDRNPARSKRTMEAMLKMKKLNIRRLKKAHSGK